MLKLKRMLPYLAIILLGYLVLPFIQFGYAIFYVPFLIVICAVIYGIKNSFHWTYLIFALLVGVLFIPTIYIYMNDTGLIYIAIFTVFALVGSLVGRLFGIRAP